MNVNECENLQDFEGLFDNLNNSAINKLSSSDIIKFYNYMKRCLKSMESMEKLFVKMMNED